MGVLLLGGAWALGSVVVGLGVGAVVARAERPVPVPAAGPTTAGSTLTTLSTVTSATAAAPSAAGALLADPGAASA